MPIPQITGTHSQEALRWAFERLRDAYAQLLLHPGPADAMQALAFHAVERIHLANCAVLGWHDAEVLRSGAFSEAVETVPAVPDAQESDFGAFVEAGGAP